MKPSINPYAPWRSAFEVWALTVQAQTVIALRLMGMAGVLTPSKRENRTMAAEKAPAFARAAIAAGTAVATGKTPDQVLSAAVKPLSKRTRSNVRRLTKPKRPAS